MRQSKYVFDSKSGFIALMSIIPQQGVERMN